MNLVARLFDDRFHKVLLSVYLHNEFQGYTQLEELAKTIKLKFPKETTLLSAVEKHARDEKKHYQMFRKYFKDTNAIPYSVAPQLGYFDRFIHLVFKKWSWELDHASLLENRNLFARLCRIVMVTEERGLKQVQSLLKMRSIVTCPRLSKIFKIIEADEPSHFLPYRAWLIRNGFSVNSAKERWVDRYIHYSVVFFIFPALFFNPFLKKQQSL